MNIIMKPLVSIIVPVYNVEMYLVECMESIIHQSLKNIEIICVDDGSTDNSGLLLEMYARKDDRVRVYHNSNEGYGKAMNYGLSLASGEFVGIVEPDDYVISNMFEKLYIVAKENSVDFVKSNFKRFYGELECRTYENVLLSENEDFYNRVIVPKDEPSILYAVMNIWTGIYNREFLINNNIKFNETPGASFQDNGFWFQTMVLANKTFFLNDFFYMNRRDNPNSSVKGREKALCVLNEFAFIEKFLNMHSEIKNIFIEHFVKCKLIGYIGAYNRSSTKHKIIFIMKASEDLRRHLESGELNKEIYGPIQWKNINMIISDPIQFFLEDIGGKGNGYHRYLAETYEKIAVAQNKLSSLEKMAATTIVNLDSYQEEQTKVTIIVPAYNVEQYIDQCIESILKQTLNNIEIICVDDGSTDGTFDKLLKWTRIDRRIKLVCQSNKGSGIARNQAMKIATGKYVLFMDADDWYPSIDVVERLYTVAIEKDMLIVGGGMQAYKDGKPCENPDYYTFPQEGPVSFSDYQLDYGYTKFIYDLHFLKENQIDFPNYTRYQDPLFFVKALSKVKFFYAIEDIVYAYRKTNKKKRFNAKQCRDILLALEEEETIARRYKYGILQERIRERFLEEYFDSYAFYLCSNEPIVVEAFKLLFIILDDETKKKFVNKITFFISTKYIIPLKRAEQKSEDIESLKERLNKMSLEKEMAEREWKQARFEVNSIRSSYSYKIGLFVSFIPRKLRNLFQKIKRNVE